MMKSTTFFYFSILPQIGAQNPRKNLNFPVFSAVNFSVLNWDFNIARTWLKVGGFDNSLFLKMAIFVVSRILLTTGSIFGSPRIICESLKYSKLNPCGLSQSIISCQTPVVKSHSQNRCKIVSSSTLQKLQFGDSKILYKWSLEFVANIRCKILYWNICIHVSRLQVFGRTKILFQKISSSGVNSSFFHLHTGERGVNFFEVNCFLTIWLHLLSPKIVKMCCWHLGPKSSSDLSINIFNSGGIALVKRI